MRILKDISRSSEHFPLRIKCSGCASELEVGLDDLEYGRWKVGGYWFAGTEELESKYTFKCPACGTEANGNEVDEELIPLGTQNDLKAAYQTRKDAGEPII